MYLLFPLCVATAANYTGTTLPEQLQHVLAKRIAQFAIVFFIALLQLPRSISIDAHTIRAVNESAAAAPQDVIFSDLGSSPTPPPQQQQNASSSKIVIELGTWMRIGIAAYVLFLYYALSLSHGVVMWFMLALGFAFFIHSNVFILAALTLLAFVVFCSAN